MACSSTLQKLLKTPQTLTKPLKLLTNHLTQLHKPQPQQPSQQEAVLFINNTNAADILKTKENSVFFPSFPFGFFPNPISPSGSAVYESDGVEVWADSVKKKRKKKMNKHKYKKLRKRVRGH